MSDAPTRASKDDTANPPGACGHSEIGPVPHAPSCPYGVTTGTATMAIETISELHNRGVNITSLTAETTDAG